MQHPMRGAKVSSKKVSKANFKVTSRLMFILASGVAVQDCSEWGQESNAARFPSLSSRALAASSLKVSKCHVLLLMAFAVCLQS